MYADVLADMKHSRAPAASGLETSNIIKTTHAVVPPVLSFRNTT